MPTPTNHLHPFAAGPGANTLTQESWEAILATPGGGIVGGGFVDGIASATQINTVLRQVSVVAAALGQFVVDIAQIDVLDDGSTANFETGFRAALDALYVPLSALNSYVKTSDFTSNQLLQPNGYQGIPGGWFMQCGRHTNTTDDEFVYFPEPFPTQCFVVISGINGANPNSSVNQQASNPTRFGFYLHAQAQERSSFWFAVGN